MSKRHFTLHELIKSETADKLGIVNVPNFAQVQLLALFVDSLLEPLRVAAQRPIIITSGYRCEQLNKAVGGVAGSYHTLRDGHCAADISLGNAGLNRSFHSLMEKSDLPINEWILGKDAAYIHVSWHPWKRKREIARK